MKKILFSICNYITNCPLCKNYHNDHEIYVIKMLNELYKIKNYKIDILLFSNIEPNKQEFLHAFKNIDNSNITILEKNYPQEPGRNINSDIGFYLHHMYKLYFIKEQNNYDIFIHTYNDHFFTEQHFDTFLEINQKIDNYKYIPGFIQYEIFNNKRYFINLHPIHAGGKTLILNNDKNILNNINNVPYIRFANLHQAFFMVSKEQLKFAITSDNFLKKCRPDIRVSAVTDIYQFCGLTKIFPINYYENLLIHHLPNKYVSQNMWMYSEEEFIEELNKQSIYV